MAKNKKKEIKLNLEMLAMCCRIENVPLYIAVNVIEKHNQFKTWDLEAYVANPPSAKVIEKVKAAYELYLL